MNALVVVWGLFILSAHAQAADIPPGRALFDAAGCNSCHRIGDKGGTAGPDLTYVGFRRSRTWLDLWLKEPRAWKKDTMMPDFRLPPKTRQAIVDYLASLQGGDFSGHGPWNAPNLREDPERKGRIIYNRAGCVACHGPQGTGGHPNNNVPGGAIPALNHVSESYTLGELEEKIRRGAKPEKADFSGPEPLVFMPAWGQAFQDSEIKAVSAYLMTVGGAAKDAQW